MNATSDLNACGVAGISDDSSDFSTWPEVILYPILLAIGTLGNCAVLHVLKTDAKSSRSFNSICVYLGSMAACHLLMLWQYFPAYIYTVELTTGSETEISASTPFTQFILVYLGLSTWIGSVLMGTSEWVLVIFSLERVAAVTFPIEIRKHASAALALKIVLVCLAINFISATENLASHFYSYAKLNVESSTENNQGNAINVPDWLRQWENLQEAFGITSMIIRFIILLVTNLTLIIFINRRRKQSQRCSSPTLSTGSKQPARTKERKHANLLLFASYALYFSTHLPVLVYTILTLAASPPFCTYQFPGNAQPLWSAASNLLILSDCSLTILFYGSVSRKFRKPFCCLGKRVPLNQAVSSTESLESGSTTVGH
ncbi:hypothetical protein BV898_03249 [Hypsibius exemplaris]|uniref:G-protein coupled receptors family 1 profile domain-containing protein n=1 Tax=Hypsibius exemplaris TaxID=2072580 RepID=A0A1W0X5P4_HYPEX|nr:hypothetical protein BV898_03249 [Hypsibius exemplaris]